MSVVLAPAAVPGPFPTKISVLSTSNKFIFQDNVEAPPKRNPLCSVNGNDDRDKDWNSEPKRECTIQHNASPSFDEKENMHPVTGAILGSAVRTSPAHNSNIRSAPARRPFNELAGLRVRSDLFAASHNAGTSNGQRFKAAEGGKRGLSARTSAFR
mmetsp:Transcript_10575/g.20536  ORF Transcript_10575/g.20536 Transcript_10575/m.20536 type:complete len:156 (-) Transcript_10575:211-678(-)